MEKTQVFKQKLNPRKCGLLFNHHKWTVVFAWKNRMQPFAGYYRICEKCGETQYNGWKDACSSNPFGDTEGSYSGYRKLDFDTWLKWLNDVKKRYEEWKREQELEVIQNAEGKRNAIHWLGNISK